MVPSCAFISPCRPRWGESSPCVRITRNTRVRETRIRSRGSAAARGPCDGPHPGTVSGPGQCEPLEWAMTQSNLGNALVTLGEREGGPERLEQAVAAYTEALKERTRERVPLEWAMTQSNLGAALAALGEREGGPERLEQAVAAYTEALKERTRERVPLEWAMTQSNLGAALAALGEREGWARAP